MNEGIIFLWICWLLWTYATFLMEKSNNLRLFIASNSLMVIILSNKFLEMNQWTINFSVVYIILLGVWLMRKSSIKQLVYSFLTILLYSSLKIYYIVDPILFFYSEKLFLVIGSAVLLLLFFNDWKSRIGSLFLMVGLGEVLFAKIIMLYMEDTYTIGLDVLDIYSAVFICLSILFLYGLFLSEGKKLITAQKNQLKKEQL